MSVVVSNHIQHPTDTTSANGYVWQLSNCDEREKLSFIQKHSLNEVIARLLITRGIRLEEVESFLNPTIKQFLPDPFHLKDMVIAANRLADAVINNQKITIFGDYDVDGATSSALLKRFFALLGFEVGVYIPDRITEGYGPNSNAFRLLKEQGTEIIVTVDCGTMAFEPLEVAAQLSLEVIVVDHHLSGDTLPKAVAIINPNRIDESSPYRYLAAVGVAFLLAVAVKVKLKEKGFFKDKAEPDLLSLLDLVALGTVCDVVPLEGLNRAFVKQGLKILSKRQNTGLSVLYDICGVNDYPNTYHLGFILGPRINAGGRVGQADLGVKLLSSDDFMHSNSIARMLNEFNEERKAIEMMVLEEAMDQAEQHASNSSVIMVKGNNWHPGVIGIVASRLKEKFNKPIAVIALDNEVGKASCRSIKGVDFGSAIVSAKMLELVTAGGGHAMAAGFTVPAHKIEDLRGYLEERFAKEILASNQSNIRYFDAFLSTNGLTVDLAKTLEQLGPFGSGSPEPRVLIDNLYVVNYQIFSESHIKLVLANSRSGTGQSFKAMAFRAIGTPIGDALLNSSGKPLHLVGHIKINRWQGSEKAELMIDDVIVG
jgi:single-stranded-DNA-specific exonuclease